MSLADTRYRQHIADMLPHRGTLWQLGGMLLEAHPKVPSDASAAELRGTWRKVKGNVIIAQASSMEEVMNELRKDCYATDGVWDLDRAEIRPFESLFRKSKGFDGD